MPLKPKEKRRERTKAIKRGLQVADNDDDDEEKQMTPLEIEIDDLERKIESSTRTIGFEKEI